ncbi:MAG: hypothetical protein WCO25_02735 [Candidatus Uhrbacteria bacterium]
MSTQTFRPVWYPIYIGTHHSFEPFLAAAMEYRRLVTSSAIGHLARIEWSKKRSKVDVTLCHAEHLGLDRPHRLSELYDLAVSRGLHPCVPEIAPALFEQFPSRRWQNEYVRLAMKGLPSARHQEPELFGILWKTRVGRPYLNTNHESADHLQDHRILRAWSKQPSSQD